MPSGSGPFDEDRLYRDAETYFRFGWHRSGTEADQRTAAWLRRRLSSAGLQAISMNWTLPQFFLQASCVIVGDRTLECLPFWLPTSTGDATVRAPLLACTQGEMPATIRGRVVLADQQRLTTSDQMQDFVHKAYQRDARAVVFVSSHPAGSIVAMNCVEPYLGLAQPIPTVMVSRTELATLSTAAAAAEPVEIIVQGESRARTMISNVIGSIPRGDNWIVVSTPFSGWFGCAGERGSGIAIWLALAHWAATRETGCGYRFVANSGHELGYAGAEKTLESPMAPAPEKTCCWLHLGANIGVVEYTAGEAGYCRQAKQTARTQVMASAQLEPLIRPCVQQIARGQIATDRFVGELANVSRRGYRVFGLVNLGESFPWFHTDRDRMDSVDGGKLALIAQTVANTLIAIENSQDR